MLPWLPRPDTGAGRVSGRRKGVGGESNPHRRRHDLASEGRSLGTIVPTRRAQVPPFFAPPGFSPGLRPAGLPRNFKDGKISPWRPEVR